MTTHRADARRLLSRLLGPHGPELTCEQCFEQLDRYVELQRAHADADAQIPGMRAHLNGCPACADDQDSLHAFLTDHDRGTARHRPHDADDPAPGGNSRAGHRDADAEPPPAGGPTDASV